MVKGNKMPNNIFDYDGHQINTVELKRGGLIINFLEEKRNLHAWFTIDGYRVQKGDVGNFYCQQANSEIYI